MIFCSKAATISSGVWIIPPVLPKCSTGTLCSTASLTSSTIWPAFSSTLKIPLTWSLNSNNACFGKGNNVIGYNIVGNNKRSLKGKIFEHDSGGECKGDGMSFRLVLSEPGDDIWDGVFKLALQSCPDHDVNGEIIEGGSIFYSGVGVWKSNNGKLSGDISLSK